MKDALNQWIEFPTKLVQTTISRPTTNATYPAITICNPNGFDVGEYIRAVYDNFQYREVITLVTMLFSADPVVPPISSKPTPKDFQNLPTSPLMFFPNSKSLLA